jgi:hypothetical protein
MTSNYYESTPEEIAIALKRALDDVGLTYMELLRKRQAGMTNSKEAMVWLAVRDLEHYLDPEYLGE